MPNNYFEFKQFRIEQGATAMKVGTDGVLLGAWANCVHAKQTLDIGTGTGLLALMVAQRSQSEITAIEINSEAAQQALSNVSMSKWNNRITVLNTSLQNFILDAKQAFSFIICNPPYFTQSLQSANAARTQARHNDDLPFVDLIKGVSKLITKDGLFSVILPLDCATVFINLAKKNYLYCHRQCYIKPTIDKKPKRIMLEFSKNKRQLTTETVAIETEQRHKYTNEYISLTREFYLKM